MYMLTIESLVCLILIVVSFMSGKMISDRYNERTISELQYQLRLEAARNGVGYVAPPVKKKVPIGQPFMDKLKEEGRAIQKFSSHD